MLRTKSQNFDTRYDIIFRSLVSGIAGGAPRVTPYYDVKLNFTDLWWRPCFFILCGLQPHLDRKRTNFTAKTFFFFFFGLYLFLDRKRVTPRNPSAGAATPLSLMLKSFNKGCADIGSLLSRLASRSSSTFSFCLNKVFFIFVSFLFLQGKTRKCLSHVHVFYKD